MKQRIGLGIGLVFFFLLFPIKLYGKTYLTKEEALKIAFSEASRIEKRIVIINGEQRQKIKTLAKTNKISRTFTYYEGMKENKTVGYPVIQNRWGKLSYITFMVVTDTKGVIESVKVLAYRELRGVEIRHKRFLQQFEGKTVNDPLRLNSDIDAITGATISSRALTNGVREILAYLYVIIQK